MLQVTWYARVVFSGSFTLFFDEFINFAVTSAQGISKSGNQHVAIATNQWLFQKHGQ